MYHLIQPVISLAMGFPHQADGKLCSLYYLPHKHLSTELWKSWYPECGLDKEYKSGSTPPPSQIWMVGFPPAFWPFKAKMSVQRERGWAGSPGAWSQFPHQMQEKDNMDEMKSTISLSLLTPSVSFCPQVRLAQTTLLERKLGRTRLKAGQNEGAVQKLPLPSCCFLLSWFILY